MELLQKYRKQETELKKSVEENMKQAFWDIYRAELEKPKPNYSVFIPLIREVIDHVEKCVPNNPDFIEEYTDALDLQYIEDIIDEDVIEKCDLDKIVTITIDTIKRLHSAVNDKNIEDWRKQLRDETDISKYLIGFFQGTFTRLNVIHEEKLAFAKHCVSNRYNKV